MGTAVHATFFVLNSDYPVRLFLLHSTLFSVRIRITKCQFENSNWFIKRSQRNMSTLINFSGTTAASSTPPNDRTNNYILMIYIHDPKMYTKFQFNETKQQQTVYLCMFKCSRKFAQMFVQFLHRANSKTKMKKKHSRWISHIRFNCLPNNWKFIL